MKVKVRNITSQETTTVDAQTVQLRIPKDGLYALEVTMGGEGSPVEILAGNNGHGNVINGPFHALRLVNKRRVTVRAHVRHYKSGDVHVPSYTKQRPTYYRRKKRVMYERSHDEVRGMAKRNRALAVR